MNKQQEKKPVGQAGADMNSRKKTPHHANNATRITAQDLAGRLDAKRNGNGWMARCPAHEDNTPSLHISERNDGSVGLYCYAGCKFESVIAALGIESRQLQPPKIDSSDPVGTLASIRGWKRTALELLGAKPSENGREVLVPMRDADGKITGHRRRRGDNQNFPHEVKAIAFKGDKTGLMMTHPLPEGTVYTTESEADAAAILTHNPELAVIATPGANLKKACLDYLRAITKGQDVILLPDPDPAGTKWARDIEHALKGRSVLIVPPAEDDTDKRLKAGEKLEDILATAEQPLANERRETIYLNGSWLEIIRAIAKIVGPKHEIFYHSGEIVRLATETDVPHLVPLRPVQACSELERFCRFIHVDKKGNVLPCRLTEITAKPIISGPEFARKIPKIKRLADYPQPIKQGGKIRLTKHGYDPETQTFTDPGGLAPESMDAEKGLALLYHLLADFCFAELNEDGGMHYKMNALAYLLTCHCRLLIEPERSPVFEALGNREGVGKDYLLGLGALLVTGRNPEFTAPTRDAEETRKRILAICRAGRRFMIISNVKGHLNDAALEQAATSPSHTDRVLGKSEELTFPNTAIYCVSGNQLSKSPDIARRMIPIELAFFGEDIEQREFTHPDLYAHALENRGRYLGALQSLVDTWIKNGAKPGSKPKASFNRWASVIGGILEACDLPNPISEGPQSTTRSDEAEHVQELLKFAYEENGDNPLTAKKLQEIAANNELFGWLGDLTSDHKAKVKFGWIMKNMELRRFAGLYAVSDRTSRRTSWRIIKES